ncbi:Acyltransferase family protein [compost metagenome]
MAVLIFHYAFRGHAYDDLSLMSYPWIIPVAKYGYLGVQFFFMISGFVIFMTATNATPVSFIRSRIIRLYPAFWACCTITFLVITIADDPKFTASFSQYLLNMTMTSGFFQQPSIDGAYWSIFVEIRFYILIAIVLFLRQMKHAEYLMLAWLAYTAYTAFFGEGRLSIHLISDYAPFFIAGASLFLVRRNGVSTLRTITIFGSFLLALHQALKQAELISPIFRSEVSPIIVTAIISSFFIIMSLSALRKTGTIGKRNWSTIGALTYPLYLLHQFIGYIIFNHFYATTNIHILFFGTTLLMILMAYAINKLVEKPAATKLYYLMSRTQQLRP